MEIKRDLYLSALINRKENGLVKVITGIRRCGKSYLLNTIFYNYLISEGVKADHIIRFAFDSPKICCLSAKILLNLKKKTEKPIPKNLWHIYTLKSRMKGLITFCLTKFSFWIALKAS